MYVCESKIKLKIKSFVTITKTNPKMGLRKGASVLMHPYIIWRQKQFIKTWQCISLIYVQPLASESTLNVSFALKRDLFNLLAFLEKAFNTNNQSAHNITYMQRFIWNSISVHICNKNNFFVKNNFTSTMVPVVYPHFKIRDTTSIESAIQCESKHNKKHK